MLDLGLAVKYAIDQILSLIETGALPSPKAYGAVAVLPDGAGVSYGKHQSTDAGGTLDQIVRFYVDAGRRYATQLEEYLDELAANETAKLDPNSLPLWATRLCELLKTAGDDPVMQRVQDAVFDAEYWMPMLRHAASAGLELPLSHLVLYDTAIQSGPAAIPRMRRLFPDAAPSRGGDEEQWTRAYVTARHTYLTTFKSPKADPVAAATHERTVRKSAYRTRVLHALVSANRWMLTLPLEVIINGRTTVITDKSAPK